MIGNDIVDLYLSRVESNWKRKGFLEKIFTIHEQQLILKSENPETMVWNLWSRKEAVYKIYHRQTKIRAFIPKQLECNELGVSQNKILGKVTVNGCDYYTETEVNSDFIYTIAVTKMKNFEKIIMVEVEDISKDQYEIPYHSLTQNPVSISHHGRFERKIQLDINS
jgi:phosphopantetheinyl transferase (holo-ACP synthase)